MEYGELDIKIDELERQVEIFADGTHSWKEVWDDIRSIGGSFKETRYPSRSGKDSAWERFQEIVQSVKASQERECRELDQKIDELEGLVEEAENGERNWKEVWNNIRSVNQSFKSVSYPSRLDKDSAWERFQEIVQRMKAYQEEVQVKREHQQEEWARRVEISKRHREEIITQAELGQAQNLAADLFGGLIDGFVEAVADFSTLGLFNVESSAEWQRLHYRSERMSEVWHLFAEYKQEMFPSDKQEVFQRLTELQMELDDAWRKFKEVCNEARQRAREAQQQAFEERQRAWQEKIQAETDVLEERLSQEHEKLERREEHLEKLEDMLDDARGDDYRERVEEWIAEEEERIGNIREKIERIEGWVEEKKNKLS